MKYEVIVSAALEVEAESWEQAEQIADSYLEGIRLQGKAPSPRIKDYTVEESNEVCGSCGAVGGHQPGERCA